MIGGFSRDKVSLWFQMLRYPVSGRAAGLADVGREIEVFEILY